jgi:hypothetical protein
MLLWTYGFWLSINLPCLQWLGFKELHVAQNPGQHACSVFVPKRELLCSSPVAASHLSLGPLNLHFLLVLLGVLVCTLVICGSICSFYDSAR